MLKNADARGRKSGVAPCCCPPLTDGRFTQAEAELTARAFEALSDPIRLRLVSAVASHPAGEACVCEISDVGVSEPTFSYHLKKLRQVGLLTADRRGTWIYYRVAPSVLAAMRHMLSDRR